MGNTLIFKNEIYLVLDPALFTEHYKKGSEVLSESRKDIEDLDLCIEYERKFDYLVQRENIRGIQRLIARPYN